MKTGTTDAWGRYRARWIEFADHGAWLRVGWWSRCPSGITQGLLRRSKGRVECWQITIWRLSICFYWNAI